MEEIFEEQLLFGWEKCGSSETEVITGFGAVAAASPSAAPAVAAAAPNAAAAAAAAVAVDAVVAETSVCVGCWCG